MFAQKYIPKVLPLILLLLFVAGMPPPDVAVEPAPQYDALFQRKDGWTGADGAYSVPLSDEVTLWLFGDTWIGPIRDGRHVNARIVNNSIALLAGQEPVRARISFFEGRTPDGRLAAFFEPADGRGWFWPYHGILTPEGLYIFLMQIDRAGVSDFRVIGSWLGHVPNPRDPPTQWRIRQTKIPWAQFTCSGDLFFGSALLKDGNFIYIYGSDEEIINGFHRKYMILARVTESRLGEFDQWRFYTNGQWRPDFTAASRLGGGLANEYSVSLQPALGKYIAVYTEDGISGKIVARLAPQPWGPWGAPLTLHQCPEADWDPDYFCYAAKAHPAMAIRPNELIVSYVVNSMDFERMAADARIYRPRFIRVKFR
ncbi:MAG: DUF4185 domain-containing protein [Desulfobacterales bacterium]|nr:MAG: DUF4185 domain-containing protein [Desulfobacterales bacterium]